jgi:hypothetical protein
MTRVVTRSEVLQDARYAGQFASGPTGNKYLFPSNGAQVLANMRKRP